jgi:Domain of unknown function (DUF4168)
MANIRSIDRVIARANQQLQPISTTVDRPMANRSSQFSRLPWGDRLRQVGRSVGKILLSIGLIGCLISGLWGSTLIPAWAAPEPIPLAAPLEAAPISPDASAVPAEKVTQFVRAYLQVLALLERREGELRQAETEPEANRLEQEIELEAFEAIEQAGLKPQEYVQLLSLANNDPDFGERIAARLQELEAEPR